MIVFSVGISWCSLHHDIPTENTIILYHPIYKGKNSNIRILMVNAGMVQNFSFFCTGISWCRLYHDIPTENTIILYHPYIQGEKFKHKDIDGQCRNSTKL